jgi:hypothetical protein
VLMGRFLKIGLLFLFNIFVIKQKEKSICYWEIKYSSIFDGVKCVPVRYSANDKSYLSESEPRRWVRQMEL